MRLRLWQRIFVYTVGLLVISQLLSFLLYNALVQEDMRRYFADSAKAVAEDLDGESLETVLGHIRIYSHGQHKLWLTNADGSALPGMGFSESEIARSGVIDRWEEKGISVLAVDGDPRFWARIPVVLAEGPYLMFMSFGPPPGLLRLGILFQLIAPVLIVGVTMAFWMAWRVSRPLRRLRDEVGDIAEGGPEQTVTVDGKDEIADVAKAVNSMAERLARHVRGMRSLLANVSHELRSPLARANLALGIVQESLPPRFSEPEILAAKALAGDLEIFTDRDRMAAKYLAALQEELDHMDSLIGTTLLAQKIEIQHESVPMEPVDFSALCRDVWRRYKPQFERKSFTVEADVKGGLTVVGNRILLLQLLANLLDNGVKYTDQGGLLRFSLAVRGARCILSVENSHETVDEAKLDHVFDPFYRIDQATGTGVGLGLSLVQKTVALHGGEIMAVPTEIGLCFCVQLPLAPS